MWARVVELMLGVWLALSPFVFHHRPGEVFLWWNDYVCAFAIVAAALLSFRSGWGKAHLTHLAVAAWLVGSTYVLAPVPPPAAFQNHVVVGWLLAIFAIIPSHASTPPRGWERFYADRSDDSSRELES